MRVTPYAAIEIRNSKGKTIYTHANNSGPPVRVLPADKVAEMNNIMTRVVTEGTGRAAQIPGLVISGKTGTTNNSTNAWFNAFTGNLVGSVWFGNDDNSPCGNLVGGSLPAQTWREIMAFAHQGLEAKPPFGVAAPAPASGAQATIAAAKTNSGSDEASPPSVALSARTTKAILDIGDLARRAQRSGRTSAVSPARPSETAGGVATARTDPVSP